MAKRLKSLGKRDVLGRGANKMKFRFFHVAHKVLISPTWFLAISCPALYASVTNTEYQWFSTRQTVSCLPIPILFFSPALSTPNDPFKQLSGRRYICTASVTAPTPRLREWCLCMLLTHRIMSSWGQGRVHPCISSASTVIINSKLSCIKPSVSMEYA